MKKKGNKLKSKLEKTPYRNIKNNNNNKKTKTNKITNNLN